MKTILIAIILSVTTNVYSNDNGLALGKGKKENRDVCLDLKDQAGPLYGLCNAYCSDPNKKEDHKKSVLKAYNNLKKESDPDMPCLVPPVTCPTFTQEDVDRLGNNIDETYTGFMRNLFDWDTGGGTYQFSYFAHYNTLDRSLYDEAVAVYLLSDGSYNAFFISYGTNVDIEKGRVDNGITKEEARACHELLTSAVNRFPLGQSTISNGEFIFTTTQFDTICTENCPSLYE